jgi:hypothetical protein
VMILVTCTISTFTVARAAARMAVLEVKKDEEAEEQPEQRMLVPVAHEQEVEPLVELAVLMSKPRSRERQFALHVVDEQGSRNGGKKLGEKLLDKAVKVAAATDTRLEPLMRHDINTASGIAYTVKEYQITDVVLGLGDRGHDHLFGPQADALIARTNRSIYLYRPVQPLGTVQRIVVVVPPKAEFEIGFASWYQRLANLARQTGAVLRFHALPTTLERLKALVERSTNPVPANFEELDSWDDILIIGRHLRSNDLLVVITARRNSLSYDALFEKLPRLLSRYFKETGFIVVYPEQMGDEFQNRSSLDPSMGEVLEDGVKTLDSAGRFVKKIFTGGKG